MMSNIVTLGLPLMAGLALGALFFGGLWWTVRVALVSKQPAVWMLGSHLLRTAVTVAGFYFIAKGNWQSLLVCLAGFLVSRASIILLIRHAGASQLSTQESPSENSLLYAVSEDRCATQPR